MSKVQGVVEAVSTKFGKFSVMIGDNWYGTKQEWAPDPAPSKGDTIEFDSGATGKYLQKVKILERTTGPSGSSGSPAPKGKTWSNLGVELGHASNIAKDMALGADLEVGTTEWYKFWVEHTEKVFKVMKGLRAKYEDEGSDDPAKKVADDIILRKAPKSEPSTEGPEAPETPIEEDIF